MLKNMHYLESEKSSISSVCGESFSENKISCCCNDSMAKLAVLEKK